MNLKWNCGILDWIIIKLMSTITPVSVDKSDMDNLISILNVAGPIVIA